MRRALFYTKHTDKFTSSKDNLLEILGKWGNKKNCIPNPCHCLAAVSPTPVFGQV